MIYAVPGHTVCICSLGDNFIAWYSSLICHALSEGNLWGNKLTKFTKKWTDRMHYDCKKLTAFLAFPIDVLSWSCCILISVRGNVLGKGDVHRSKSLTYWHTSQGLSCWLMLVICWALCHLHGSDTDLNSILLLLVHLSNFKFFVEMSRNPQLNKMPELQKAV